MKDGFLLLHKPSGIRCADLLNNMKRRLSVKSAGYAGTLDFFASGLLIAGLGKATKLLKYIMELDKTYEAVIRLGRATDTLDPEGRITGEAPPPGNRTAVEEAISSFRGSFEQIPPLYSSKKIDGRRASDMAREGLLPALKPVPITIHDLSLDEFDPSGLLRLTVRCSSGTYIRSLARDIGTKLAVPAMVESLIRTANGPFRLTEAHPPDCADWEDHILLPEDCLPFLPCAELKPEAVLRVRNGGSFTDADCISGDLQKSPCRIIFHNTLLAIAKRQDGRFRILDNFGN